MQRIAEAKIERKPPKAAKPQGWIPCGWPQITYGHPVSGSEEREARGMNTRRAVIAGIGPITCIGMGVENFWKGILAEKSGVRRISTFDTSLFHAYCGGALPAWNPAKIFSPPRGDIF